MKRVFRQPINPRVTVQLFKLHAYIFVDGKGVCTVADLDCYDALLEAVERYASCANTTVISEGKK